MKRIFDFSCSLLGCVLLLPVFCMIAFLIMRDSPGGVFFRGVRVGKNGRPFRIYKFRSMIKGAEGNGKWNVGDTDQRITRIGHFLRNSKIDELPQLINVLKGEMSLVGPRPELKYYVDMYTERERAILDLKPGVTDWASLVNIAQFKEFTKTEDPDRIYLENIRPIKLRLQLYYRYHNSFLDDIYCLLWTIYKVMTRSNALPGKIEKIVYGYKDEVEERISL